MGEFKMDDNLYTSFEEIDRQHANLFRIINMLKCINKDNIDDNVSIIIDELKNYISYHFTTEEKILKSYNYVKLDQHKKEHESFTDKMDDFDFDFLVGTPDLGKKMLIYLENWLKKHILISDQKAFKEIEEINNYNK